MSLDPLGVAPLRAEGALWGAWRTFYEGYRFPEGSGSISDDIELTKAVERGRGLGLTARDALVYKIPPGSLHDFCVATLRFYYASGKSQLQDFVKYKEVFFQEARHDPLKAMAYVAYRLYAIAFASRFVQGANSETWEIAWTTKRDSSDR